MVEKNIGNEEKVLTYELKRIIGVSIEINRIS